VSGRSQNALRAPRGPAQPPLLSVGLIAESGRAPRHAETRRLGRARRRAPAAPLPSAVPAYHTHEYNWSITTARALSLSHSIGLASFRPCVVCPVRSQRLFASVFLGLWRLGRPRTHVRHTVGKGRRCRTRRRRLFWITA